MKIKWEEMILAHAEAEKNIKNAVAVRPAKNGAQFGRRFFVFKNGLKIEDVHPVQK